MNVGIVTTLPCMAFVFGWGRTRTSNVRESAPSYLDAERRCGTVHIGLKRVGRRRLLRLASSSASTSTALLLPRRWGRNGVMNARDSPALWSGAAATAAASHPRII